MRDLNPVSACIGRGAVASMSGRFYCCRWLTLLLAGVQSRLLQYLFRSSPCSTDTTGGAGLASVASRFSSNSVTYPSVRIAAFIFWLSDSAERRARPLIQQCRPVPLDSHRWTRRCALPALTGSVASRKRGVNGRPNNSFTGWVRFFVRALCPRPVVVPRRCQLAAR